MKPRLFDGIQTIEFDTEAEHDAYVASNSPTPDLTDVIKQYKREELARDLLRDIWTAFNNLSMTDANKFTLMQTITVVLIAIQGGFFNAAKTYALLIPTNGIYTAGRQTALVNMIQVYIDQTA